MVELVVMLVVAGGIYVGWLLWRERPRVNRLLAMVRS
jgi:hypothetical protein